MVPIDEDGTIKDIWPRNKGEWLRELASVLAVPSEQTAGRGRFHVRFANAAGNGASLLCRIPFAFRIKLYPCSRWPHRGYCQYYPYATIAESRSCNRTSTLITCAR